MSAVKSARLTATTMVLAAAILALVCLLPSLSRPAPVSAQTCGYGTTFVNGVCSAVGGCSQFLFGYNCSSNCSGSSIGCYNNGSCQGGFYSTGYGCAQTNTGNCPSGFIYSGTGCSVYSAGNCPSGTVFNGIGCQANSACSIGYSYSNCANTGNCTLGYAYSAVGCSNSASCSYSYINSGCANYGCTQVSAYSMSSCNNSTNCPSGYATAYGCTNSTTCASAGFSVGSSSGYCSTNYNGVNNVNNGSCAGKVLQLGQTCSNGVVSGAVTCPNGQAIAQGGVCSAAAAINATVTNSAFCSADGLLPVVEACQSASQTTAAASANQCAGLTLSSGQTCSNGVVTCPNQQIVAAGQPCPAAATTTATNSALGGVSVTYSGGWNLVAAPGGTSISGAGGSLYTFQVGDSDYETLPAGATVKAGQGYWAYFGSAVTDSVPQTSAGTVTTPLSAGTSVMIGNSGSSMATVTGADSVLVFDPVSGTYSQSTTLRPGQGAWASSASDGQVTITNQ